MSTVSIASACLEYPVTLHESADIFLEPIQAPTRRFGWLPRWSGQTVTAWSKSATGSSTAGTRMNC